MTSDSLQLLFLIFFFWGGWDGERLGREIFDLTELGIVAKIQQILLEGKLYFCILSLHNIEIGLKTFGLTVVSSRTSVSLLVHK